MKHLVFTLLAALVFSGAASAQRLMVGVRGGVNFADYSFVPTRIGDTRFTPGAVRAGYDVGFVLRLNLSKHLHLQSELNYAFVNYNVLAENSGSRRIALRTERFEIPVQLGFQFGVLRLFGGALFRVTESRAEQRPAAAQGPLQQRRRGRHGRDWASTSANSSSTSASRAARVRASGTISPPKESPGASKCPTTSSTAGPWDFSSDTVAENVPARRAPPQQAANRAFPHPETSFRHLRPALKPPPRQGLFHAPPEKTHRTASSQSPRAIFFFANR